MNRSEPNSNYVRQQLSAFENDPRYYGADEALGLVFKQWPANVELSHVLIKVVLLNRLYNTNIFAVHIVAQHIHELAIDIRLAVGDPALVETIAQVNFESGSRNFLSFASKYCAWHQPDTYPIFDSYIEWLLWEYRKQFGFARYVRCRIREYSEFIRVIDEFRKFFSLTEFSRRQIDKFLWIEAQADLPDGQIIR